VTSQASAVKHRQLSELHLNIMARAERILKADTVITELNTHTHKHTHTPNLNATNKLITFALIPYVFRNLSGQVNLAASNLAIRIIFVNEHHSVLIRATAYAVFTLSTDDPSEFKKTNITKAL
jgi:hypothetical protein